MAFAEGAFIPYLSVSYVLTRDDDRTFHKSGLLYPMVSKTGPDYGTGVLLAGPGSYRLTYIVSPPPSHGVMRHTDKASGVPDWWKPITASWTFAYPSNMSASEMRILLVCVAGNCHPGLIAPALADEPVAVTLKDHRFAPADHSRQGQPAQHDHAQQ